MSEPTPPRGDDVQRREARRAVITAELIESNRPLVPTMSEANFHAMIERMVEHQLLYEEHAPRAP